MGLQDLKVMPDLISIRLVEVNHQKFRMQCWQAFLE
jgi:hypothetical protein